MALLGNATGVQHLGAPAACRENVQRSVRGNMSTPLQRQHHGMLMLPLLITSGVSEYPVMKMCVLWEISHEVAIWERGYRARCRFGSSGQGCSVNGDSKLLADMK